MNPRIKLIFVLLILAQVAHSIEEYLHQLWEVFLPAQFLSSLISNDLTTGFIIANTSIFLLGLWCYWFRVRTGHPTAQGWIWFWIILELINGIGHPFVSISRGAYFPGVYTALVMLPLAGYLAYLMLRKGRQVIKSRVV